MFSVWICNTDIDIVYIVVFFVLFERPFSSVLLPATVNCGKNDKNLRQRGHCL